MEAAHFAATLASSEEGRGGSWGGGGVQLEKNGPDLTPRPTTLPHIIKSGGRCLTTTDNGAVSLQHPDFDADLSQNG